MDAGDALALLGALGAHPWLVRHHELVLEAGEALLDGLPEAWLAGLDRRAVRVGCALHDAGKIRHPEEMGGPGHAHEETGQALLLAASVPPELARFAVTHAAWGPGLPLEDLLVALADKLWKGRREQELEEAVVAALAERGVAPAWEVWDVADRLFEEIAAGGDDRLRRSEV